jgi:hypothetical protein
MAIATVDFCSIPLLKCMTLKLGQITVMATLSLYEILECPAKQVPHLAAVGM